METTNSMDSVTDLIYEILCENRSIEPSTCARLRGKSIRRWRWPLINFATHITPTRSDNTVENYGKEKLLAQFQDLSLVNDRNPSAASSSTEPIKSEEMSGADPISTRPLTEDEIPISECLQHVRYTVRCFKKDLAEISRESKSGRRGKKNRANRAKAKHSKERGEVINKLENKYGRRCSHEEKLLRKQSRDRRPIRPNPDIKKPERSAHATMKKKKNGSNLASGLLSMMEDLSLVRCSNDSATPSSS